MSLMVANVRERVMEIGLRRALGASQWDIAALFVMEACLVAGSAAVVATLGTNLLLSLGRQAFPTSLRLGWVSILTPLIVAVFLGIVFSYWPARFAAKITPSEALRNEERYLTPFMIRLISSGAKRVFMIKLHGTTLYRNTSELFVPI